MSFINWNDIPAARDLNEPWNPMDVTKADIVSQLLSAEGYDFTGVRGQILMFAFGLGVAVVRLRRKPISARPDVAARKKSPASVNLVKVLSATFNIGGESP